jgi:hypothetical protein
MRIARRCGDLGYARAMAPVLAEALRFVRRNRVHFLLFVPGAFAYTWFHEAMHALAVTAQGGTLLEFVITPSAGEWGHVQYTFPAGAPRSELAIALAPYLASLALCGLCCAHAALAGPRKYAIASVLYFWMYLVPLGDVGIACLPYLAGAVSGSDLQHAWGTPSVALKAGLFAAGAASALLAFPLQRRLYPREEALSLGAFSVLGVLAAGVIGIVS